MSPYENTSSRSVEKNSSGYTSLHIKTTRLVLLVSLFLILSGSITGIVLYGYHALRVYKSDSHYIMNFCLSLEDKEYLEEIYGKTRTIYENLPEEVRMDVTSDTFADYFRPLVDDDFYKARDILVKCRENTGIRNVFFMFTDVKHKAVVYVIDGDDEEWAYLPGQWVGFDGVGDENEIAKSSWRLDFTHTEEYGWIGTDAAPFYAADGRLLGYICTDLDLNVIARMIRRFLLILIPFILIIISLLALFSSKILDKYILSYLAALEKAAKIYVKRDNIEINEETPSVFAPLQINTGDELEDLWLSMTDMERDVKETMIRLRTITAIQEKLDAELSIANRIQQGMLPHEFLNQKEFELFASMEAARNVGGDFYDFFMIDERHVALVIADVSGKGMPAALFMVVSRTLIRNRAMLSGGPGAILTDVNAHLCKDNAGEMFVTVWMAVIDIETGKGLAANAGHEHPALRRADGDFELIKYRHSPMMAVMKKLKIKEHEFQLIPGDRLFVYTDGVPEATNSKGELYGTDRMVEALNRNPDVGTQELVEHVREDINTFVGDADQFDDITMLIFDYYGAS